MLSKKILASLSVIALLFGAPAVVQADDAGSVLKKQIFKTGKGVAAGQSKTATGGGSGGAGAGAGAAGGIGGVAAGTIVAGVAVAAAVAVAVAAVTDDASTTTTTTTTATCLECSGFGPNAADGGPTGPGTNNFRRDGN